MSTYIMTPIEYAKDLFSDKNYKKAGAYLEYQVDMFEKKTRTYSEYQRAWGVSKSTAHQWVKEFKIAIKRHHQYWIEANENHVKVDDFAPNAQSNAQSNAETPSATAFEAGQPNAQSNAQSNEHTLYINNIKNIVGYLNAKTAKRYKWQSDKTKRLIMARLKEGFTVEDFQAVVDVKSAQWLGTDMEKYLRPETLFGGKFEGYLNERKPKAANTGKVKRYV